MIALGYPARGLAYIRHIATAETLGGRIVIPEQVRDKMAKFQFLVVSVGNYEICKDPDECKRKHTKTGEHKHRLVEGDWIICRNRSWMLTPDPHVFCVKQSDILGKFKEE
jgi:hypothetical protein